ncbi:MAG: hypothetical protein QXF79_03205, partial [Ignisphaera sp.]
MINKSSFLRSMISKFTGLAREWGYTLILIKRSRLTATGFTLVLGFVILGIIGPYVTPYDPMAIDITGTKKLLQPSWEHLFGTDE